MAHDVFISYSSKDKPVADAVCAGLEGEAKKTVGKRGFEIEMPQAFKFKIPH